MEHFDTESSLLERVLVARQSLLDDEPKQAWVTLTGAKMGVAQQLFHLSQNELFIALRLGVPAIAQVI
jgi:hypothetical protein